MTTIVGWKFIMREWEIPGSSALFCCSHLFLRKILCRRPAGYQERNKWTEVCAAYLLGFWPTFPDDHGAHRCGGQRHRCPIAEQAAVGRIAKAELSPKLFSAFSKVFSTVSFQRLRAVELSPKWSLITDLSRQTVLLCHYMWDCLLCHSKRVLSLLVIVSDILALLVISPRNHFKWVLTLWLLVIFCEWYDPGRAGDEAPTSQPCLQWWAEPTLR